MSQENANGRKLKQRELIAGWFGCLTGRCVPVIAGSMSKNIPETVSNVTAHTKANIYFDGKVVSHSLTRADGSKLTLGLIYPGSYHFGTAKAERMEIVAGVCHVVVNGQSASNDYSAGDCFEIGANSGFTITVKDGICEYICSFLD